MIARILTRWTFARVLYLGLGLVVLIDGLATSQWISVVIGGYWAAMGLFAFGCAAGNCMGDSCEVNPQSEAVLSKPNIENLQTHKS
jgi:hypothetical protein